VVAARVGDGRKDDVCLLGHRTRASWCFEMHCSRGYSNPTDAAFGAPHDRLLGVRQWLLQREERATQEISMDVREWD
jgi:hypothetical protein